MRIEKEGVKHVCSVFLCVCVWLPIGDGRLPGCDTDMEGNRPAVPQCDAQLTYGCSPCLPRELSSGHALWCVGLR